MMKDTNIEIRKLLGNIQYRQESDSRVVEGLAVCFNSRSEDLGFYEFIHPKAITNDVIAKSDVFARLNHDPEKVLARCKNGKGSLSLSIDDTGLHYRFEAPHTALGDELLEYLKRGDLDSSSFAFIVSQDDGAETWTREEDGTIRRDIYKIDQLFDVSPVFNPAYSETTCSQRALEKVESMKDELTMKDENKDEKVVSQSTDETKDDATKDNQSEEQTQDIEQPDEPNNEEETKPNDDVKPNDEVTDEVTEDEESDKNDTKTGEQKRFIETPVKTKTNNNITMNSKFSLIGAIRNIAENRSLDDVTMAVNAAGFEEMRKAGVSAAGQLVLPVESRAISVANDGEDVVATELYDIVEPLRAKNVLIQAGAKFYTGLVGNVQIPVMTGSNVAWAGEIAEAADGGAAFNHVVLTPKRLTAYVDLSKMLLVQDSVGVENAVRQDLINAINSKLEATILGADAKSATQPAGMFNGVSPTAVTDFKGIVGLEAAVEQANVLGSISYVASPTAKANFRDMMKGSKGASYLAYNNGELDGTPVFSTSNVAANQFVVGDFSNLAIGQFGGIND